MDEKKREIRTVECKLAIREAAPGEEGNSRIIEGTAIVFDTESEVLDDYGIKFREIIKPEACTMEFLNSQDIKMNILHERELTIARCNKGQGGMQITRDEKGVHFSFEAPRCDIGDRCLELVRTGVYSGCSFEFWPEEYDVEERDGGNDIKIIHKKFRALGALTIGMDPAYRQTSVNARELYDNTPGGKATKQQREQQKVEAMQREMERRASVLAKHNSYDENF